MPLQPGDGQLPHLDFGREPDREPERRRRRGFGSAPPAPADRRQRGEVLVEETNEALSVTQQIREAAGIDPARLLVLEFESINFDVRDVFLDRFQANVVDESEEVAEDQTRMRTVVQFPTIQLLQDFVRQIELYRDQTGVLELLPPGLRKNLFDGLQTVRRIAPEDRMGMQLKSQGLPETEPFYLDVDLWHPGETNQLRTLLQQFRAFCDREGGRVTDEVCTESLSLLKVYCNRRLAERILDQDIVARVDLPPKVSETLARMFQQQDFPNLTLIPDDTDPLVCVVDSGVVSGHPLLTNWVIEEVDFDSGENTPTDLHGHGTAVAGLVVYGDVNRCLETGVWQPKVRICSAKVLRSERDPIDVDRPRAEFPEENRIEKTLEDVIRYFVEVHGLRVFNVSIGIDSDVYSGGRQFPCAEKLDELARELDIVIVVAAGNRYPEVPGGPRTRSQFQEAVRDQVLSSEHRICNPATAALSLTVGSIARTDGLPDRLRDSVPGARAGGPSPFTRTGPGYSFKATNASIKPELVDFGGNLALQTQGATTRWREDISLGEPTIQIEEGGRFVGAEFGTSFACPHVSHVAAFSQKALELTLGSAPSANLIRALVGSAAVVPPCGAEWLGDDGEMLRLAGYGVSALDLATWSKENCVRLVALDSVEEDRLHIYRFTLPEQFLMAPGRRGITVSLAFDPPVRSSRKEYLARTMWFDLLQGLTTDEVQRYKERVESGQAPRLPSGAEIDMLPKKTVVQWSTLQVRRHIWQRGLRLREASDGDASLHIVVGCQRRFKTGLLDSKQRYGLVVNLWHEGEGVRIYQALRTTIRVPAARIRIQR